MCDCNDSKFTKLRENWSRYLKCPTQCQCCQPRNKIKGKFGVAYVIETPNRKCKPCGWEVEFTDTPSTIENNCKKMMNWITCPPLGECDNGNTTVCCCSTQQDVLCTLNQSCCTSKHKTGCCSKNTRCDCCCDTACNKPIGCCCANKKPQCCCSKGTNTKPCCSKPRNDSSCCKPRCCKKRSLKSKCYRCCPEPPFSSCCPPPNDGCCCDAQPQQCCQNESDSDDCCCNQNDSNKKGCNCNCSACKCSGNKKYSKSRGVSAGSHTDKPPNKSKEATANRSKGSEESSNQPSKNLNSPEPIRLKLKASPRSPYTISMNNLPRKGPDKEEQEVIGIKTPPPSVEQNIHMVKSQEFIGDQVEPNGNQIKKSQVDQSGDNLSAAALEESKENTHTSNNGMDQPETPPPLKPPRKHLRGAALLKKIKQEHKKEMDAIHGKPIIINPVNDQEPTTVGSDDRTITTIESIDVTGDFPGQRKKIKKGRGKKLLEKIKLKHQEELEAIHHYESINIPTKI